jgi:broad specificity phosphatase PhoE
VIQKCLAPKPVSAIITSPRPRAIETAQIIAAGHTDEKGAPLQPVVVPDLDSANYGPYAPFLRSFLFFGFCFRWEGKTLEEIQTADPEHFRIFREHISQLDMSGEKLEDVATRCLDSIIAACESHKGGQVIVGITLFFIYIQFCCLFPLSFSPDLHSFCYLQGSGCSL